MWDLQAISTAKTLPSGRALPHGSLKRMGRVMVVCAVAVMSCARPGVANNQSLSTPSVTASFGLDVDRGILVLNLDSLKPVGMSGLQTGDVITALDQHQIYNMGGFWHSVLREGEPTTIQTTVQGRSGQLPLSLQRPPLQTVN